MTVTTKIGFGKKVTGEVAILGREPDLAGKIVIAPAVVGREFLEKATLLGVAGLVVPSLHWRDYEYFRKADEYPILLLLKFGRLDPSDDLVAKLEKLAGKKAILDGENHELKAD
ncbi:hypothetical protein HY440_02850 [Candidatus Microgenomates bacterium]|nr:hypothetical protein [Candidatus Microgenomates bacterium]